MKFVGFLTALVSAALVSISACTASADPLITVTAAEYSGSLCTSAFVATSCVRKLSDQGSISLGSSNLTFGLSPSPSISGMVTGGIATGLGDPVPDQTGLFANSSSLFNTPFAAAEMQYYAEIVGPDLGPITIDLNYALNALTTGVGSSARVGIFLNPSAGHNIYRVTDDQIGTGIVENGVPTPSFRSETLKVTLMPNNQFQIGMFVLLQSGASGGTATGFVDPVLYIDPSFASVDPNYLTDYQIILSPGAGNSVPEPFTLSLFGAGVVGAAALRRRKKTQKV